MVDFGNILAGFQTLLSLDSIIALIAGTVGGMVIGALPGFSAAMGVSLLPRIRYAVLPQLGPAFSSAVLYRFDVNIREASVLGLVGAGGIGAPLIFAMNQYAWNDVSAIFLGFVLLVWLIDVGSARLRTRRAAAAATGKKT